MRQLTSRDVQFLAAEDGVRTRSRVRCVDTRSRRALEGKLTLPDITRAFRERLHLLPPLCWRLVEVPLGLDYPRWFDDPDFDLDFHLRELYLPPPGHLAQLAEQVSRRCLCTNDAAFAWRRSRDRAERVAGPLALPYPLISERVTPPGVTGVGVEEQRGPWPLSAPVAELSGATGRVRFQQRGRRSRD